MRQSEKALPCSPRKVTLSSLQQNKKYFPTPLLGTLGHKSIHLRGGAHSPPLPVNYYYDLNQKCFKIYLKKGQLHRVHIII